MRRTSVPSGEQPHRTMSSSSGSMWRSRAISRGSHPQCAGDVQLIAVPIRGVATVEDEHFVVTQAQVQLGTEDGGLHGNLRGVFSGEPGAPRPVPWRSPPPATPSRPTRPCRTAVASLTGRWGAAYKPTPSSRRHSQVVRQGSAKPSFPGSNPGGASQRQRPDAKSLPHRALSFRGPPRASPEPRPSAPVGSAAHLHRADVRAAPQNGRPTFVPWSTAGAPGRRPRPGPASPPAGGGVAGGRLEGVQAHQLAVPS